MGTKRKGGNPHSPRIDQRAPPARVQPPELRGRWGGGKDLHLAEFPGPYLPLPSEGSPGTDPRPLTCPCVLGEDGLTLDVTGTQLVEKDIENLARGEVKYEKWSHEVLEVEEFLSERGYSLVVGVCQRRSWGRGVSFHFTP